MSKSTKKVVDDLPERVLSVADANKVVNAGIKKRWPIGDGLYLRVSSEKVASWEFRFTICGKRYTENLGKYGRRPIGIPYGDIRDKTAQLRFELKSGLRAAGSTFKEDSKLSKTVDDLAQRWLKKKKIQVEKVEIIEQRYNKWIKPQIGSRPFDKVKTEEIEELLDAIIARGFRTVANKALSDCKAIFNVALKRNAISQNPAQLLDRSDAGGSESSRTRKLSEDEIRIIFEVFRANSIQFVRENYLATALLLVLGVRKNELLQAKWSEFNFESNTWFIPSERVRKKGAKGYSVPLVPITIAWLNELNTRGNNSPFLFPARRRSTNEAVCENTLNAALQKLFGKGKSNGKYLYADLFTPLNIDHFVIHDLRRTSRSLLRSVSFMGKENRASFEASERHLNHKLPKMAETYDPDDFLDERREAVRVLSEKLAPLINV